MRKQILGVSSNDEKKAVKAFAEKNKGNALKTKPKVGVFLARLSWPHFVKCATPAASMFGGCEDVL
jgi:hypothetical protein